MSFALKDFFAGLKPRTLTTPTKVVGIDLGSSSVKVVALEQVDGIITLKTYGELQLGPYQDQPLGSITRLPEKKQIEALVDVLRESKVHTKTGVFTLQLSTSFVTVFSVHAKEHEDLGPRVRVEARKYIPVPMADVTLDWSELPVLGTPTESMREVLVAAVQNTAHTQAKSLLHAVGMEAQPTEIEIFSALRASSKTDDTSVAILDFGAQTSKLYIAHEGVIRKTHRIFAGGAQATQHIAKTLDISFDEAENQKRNYNAKDANALEIKKAVVTTFERPLQEFKRVLHQFEIHAGEPVARVVITGGAASFVEMKAYAGYMLDRDIEIVNPFEKVAYPAFMEDILLEIAPIFTIAMGGALRTFEVS